MFQYRSVYYAAVALDLVLRFAWTATLVPNWFAMTTTQRLANISSAWLLPIVSTCELLRRAGWIVLRLESEHLHNTEGFRRVDVVPLHFDHAVTEKKAEKAETAKGGGGRVEVLIELLVYLGVVAVLAFAAISDLKEEGSSVDEGGR